jgi:hypothetical protein
MSFVSAIPWLLGFVGPAGGGMVSDAIFRLTGNAVLARKMVLVGGLLIAAICVALAGAATGVLAAVSLTPQNFAVAINCLQSSSSRNLGIVALS